MRTRRRPSALPARSRLIRLLLVCTVALALSWAGVSITVAGDGAATQAGEPTAAPYDRAAFGPAWKDVDRNGCDTRNDILRRDLAEVRAKGGTAGCLVLTGVLRDPYTGERIVFERGPGTSDRVQIDHIVPLSYAWRHGADAWSDERRQEFANDPANLLAVAGRANSAKSDSGPSEWMPRAEYACEYTERFELVLQRYGLEAAEADLAALDNLACAT